MPATETESLARQQRVFITPLIVWHTHAELTGRGIALEDDEEWSQYNAALAHDGRKRLTFLQSLSLIKRAVALSQDPDIGMNVGFRQSAASYGFAICAMMASPTVLAAFRMGLKYHRIIGSMLKFDMVTVDADRMRITMTSRFPGSPAIRFLTQEAMVAVVTLFHFLEGRKFGMLGVSMPYKPHDTRRFEDHCACPVSYQGKEAYIEFSRAAVDVPLETADPFTLHEAETVLGFLLAQEMEEADILQSTEEHILQSLPDVATSSDIARALGMSERGLRRKLSEAGTNYREMLHRLRSARAEQLLAEGVLTRDQIAFELGYEDARSLRRLLRSDG